MKTGLKIKMKAGITPDEIIDFINTNYTELQGLCYYENKALKSRDKKVGFYFDPYHSVLEVKYNESFT